MRSCSKPYPVAVLMRTSASKSARSSGSSVKSVPRNGLSSCTHNERCRQERVAVHENGTNLGEAGAQAIEHGKTMGVDVAPVIDFTILHPAAPLNTSRL